MNINLKLLLTKSIHL